MKAFRGIAVLGLLLAVATPSVAGGRVESCSVRALAGRWIFATGVGHFPAYGGDITAIGTLNVRRDGSVSGKFDFTVSSVVHQPDVEYTGTVTVDPDCTGTLTFETTFGTTRTDSIAIVGDGEIWGMSQDPENLWTYRARRISLR